MPIRPVFPAPLAALLLFLLACAPAATGGGPHVAGDTRVAAETGTAPPPSAATTQLPREADPDDALCAPLLIEQDFGFGTHVVMRRLPTAADLEDMSFLSGLRQVVLALPEWPRSFEALQPLQQVIMPEGSEIVVLLPGWPPSREALGAWNLVGGNLRLIMVVNGPPTDRALISELNHVRSLERVIVQMQQPSRSGFERLQRPLSFRVLRP